MALSCFHLAFPLPSLSFPALFLPQSWLVCVWQWLVMQRSAQCLAVGGNVVD